jgi:ubiquitin-activating enzyme E1
MSDYSPTRAPPSKKSRMEEENVDMDIDASMDAKTLNRFSRQNAALGAETTAKLIKMAILVIGVRGIGIETIKNLALQGAGAITIIDANLAEAKDCGVNFFIHESDIGTGKSRADIVAPRVRELNPICKVSTSPVLNDDIIRQHSAVVITQIMPTSELIRIDQLCRSSGIAFFYAFAGGITASVFVDLGDNHYIVDPNGEKPLQKLITSVII